MDVVVSHQVSGSFCTNFHMIFGKVSFSMVDPGFPRGTPSRGEAPAYYLAKFLPKSV